MLINKILGVSAAVLVLYSTPSIASKTDSNKECQKDAGQKWGLCFNDCISHSSDSTTPERKCATDCALKFSKEIEECKEKSKKNSSTNKN